MSLSGKPEGKLNRPVSKAKGENGGIEVRKSKSVVFKDSEKTILKKLRQNNGSMIINIPLNQELSEDHGVINASQYKEAEIDYDFSNLFDENTIYPESQVLSINPLNSFSRQAEIDLDRLARDGFVTPHTVNTLLGNTFRMIKRPLLNNILGKGATVLDNANLIMVTSSLDGEGKSFSAINLAISMAMYRSC